MASNLNNNGSFSVTSSAIQLRANSGGVPLSHNDVDSNFENLRLAHNSVVTALAGKSASSHTHSNATTSAHGFMSSSDKSKLNGIATSANNYSLPTASSSTLGGVKVGSNINISSGTISVPLASTTTAGVVEYDNSTIKKNGSGQLYVNVGAVNTDTNTTYSAGSGLSLSGTTFSHKDTSSQGSSNNSGRTYIQDITLDGYGHVTGIGTATETVVNTNTTYSAGSGLSLSGTTFSHSNTSSAGSVNNSGNTVIQDITVDTYGHVTAIGSKTISTGGVNGLASTANVTIQNSDIIYSKLEAADGTNTSGTARDGDGIIICAGSGYGSSQSNTTGGDSGHIIIATDSGGLSDETEGSAGSIFLNAGGGIKTNRIPDYYPSAPIDMANETVYGFRTNYNVSSNRYPFLTTFNIHTYRGSRSESSGTHYLHRYPEPWTTTSSNTVGYWGSMNEFSVSWKKQGYIVHCSFNYVFDNGGGMNLGGYVAFDNLPFPVAGTGGGWFYRRANALVGHPDRYEDGNPVLVKHGLLYLQCMCNVLNDEDDPLFGHFTYTTNTL